MGRAARRAREVDRGCGAGHGERVSRVEHAAARRDADGARRNAPAVRGAARAVHAVRSRDRRADGVGRGSARVSKTSVCGSWGAIAGELRYFADKFGRPRASIEGTQLPMDVIRRFATSDDAALVYDGERRKAPLVLRRRVEYFGFELEREVEAVEEFPAGPRRRGAQGAGRCARARRGAPLRGEEQPRHHRRGARSVAALGWRVAATGSGGACGAVSAAAGDA